MKTVVIQSDYETYTRSANSLAELKRVILDEFNVKGWLFYEPNHPGNATTFHMFFKGVKAVK